MAHRHRDKFYQSNPELVKWPDSWDEPTILATCPRCGRRAERRAREHKVDEADKELIICTLSCYPAGMEMSPCYFTWFVVMKVPDEYLGKFVEWCGGTAIPSEEILPGYYKAEATRIYHGDKGEPLGLEYLVKGHWLRNNPVESVMEAEDMAKKRWADYAALRKEFPGQWELVTRDTADTALNPERLAYLKLRAEQEGLETEVRPLTEGSRRQGLWVRWPE